ncbi:hypothetical protein BV898_18335 [Hypsibius exemplaris]|uniref:Uncharacterized protein n=1 Tax=Hypsibius exemplaris TaxID=2072580 RepID=A0A9X6RND3_HYPEX|nr:hypothetical protein BV898_18335 [Hypsibius exemplaris]
MSSGSSRSTTSGYSSASHTSSNTNKLAARAAAATAGQSPGQSSRGSSHQIITLPARIGSIIERRTRRRGISHKRPHANPKTNAKKAFNGKNNGPLDKSRSQLDPL